MHILSKLFRALCPLLVAAWIFDNRALSQEQFTPPSSPRASYSFNLDWKFMRSAKPDDDLRGFEAPEFDDSTWQSVSTPHTFNDVDSFRTIISHSGGDRFF